MISRRWCIFSERNQTAEGLFLKSSYRVIVICFRFLAQSFCVHYSVILEQIKVVELSERRRQCNRNY